jgi:hypothetical protein
VITRQAPRLSSPAAGEQVLEQVAADAIALGQEELLGLQIALGRVRAGHVYELDDQARGREPGRAGRLIPGGELDDRVPDHHLAHPEGMEEVGQRHSAASAHRGVGPDEGQVLGRDGAPAQDARGERVVVLGHVLGHVGQQRRIVDRGVPRALDADHLHRVACEFVPARCQHRGDAFEAGQGGGELHSVHANPSRNGTSGQRPSRRQA